MSLKSSRLVGGILLVIFLLEDAWISFDRSSELTYLYASCFALLVGQISLVGVWVGLSSAAFIWRLLTAGAAISAATVLLATSSGYHSLTDWVTVVGTQVVALACSAYIAHQVGILPELPRVRDNRDAPSSRQFHLHQMLGLITSACVVLGVAKTLPDRLLASNRGIAEGVLLGASFAVVGMASLWAVAGGRRLAIRLALFFAAPLITSVCYTYGLYHGYGLGLQLEVGILHGIIVAAVLLLVRYRSSASIKSPA